MKTRKVVIIGAGHVGSHVALGLIQSGEADDIVLIDILKETGTRLLFAGGAGVLLVAENTMLVDTPEIPAAFKPIAEAEVIAFNKLSEAKDFDWTYMAPPAMMEYEAPHTGTHYFSGNKLGINAEGKSFISYSDYADAIIEKIFEPENHAIVGVYA